MKIKSALSVLLCIAVLCGCQDTQTANSNDPVQIYKDSFKKAEEMESYLMDADMELEIDMVNAEITMDMDSAVKDKGATARHDMEMDIMGNIQNNLMYISDGYTYTSVPDSDKFIKQSSDDNSGLSYQSLLTLSSGNMAQACIDAVDNAKNLNVSKEDGSVTVAFDFGDEDLKAITGTITAILTDSMMDTLEGQLAAQAEEMGFGGDMVSQMMGVYLRMFADVKVENIHIEKTMNKNGFCTTQDIDMSLSMDLSELLSSLGQTFDENTMKLLQNIKLDMSLDTSYENINGDVKINMPEFTDANTMTAEEAAALSK